MARVVGLGHIGPYVSPDPHAVDHEIALMTGRPPEEQHLIQQISLRVNKLDDLRDFKRRIQAEGYKVWEQTRHVPMGSVPDQKAIDAMDSAYREATAPLPAAV